MPRTPSVLPPRGTIWKSGDRWFAALRWRRPGGILVRKTFSARTRREAAAHLQDYRDDLIKGLDPTSATFAEVAQEYVDALVRRARPRTVVHERWALRHAVDRLGDVRVAELTPGDIERALDEVAATGLSTTSVRHIRATIRAVLQRAVRQNRVLRNVADTVKPPAAGEDRFRPDLAPLKDVLQLLDQLRSEDMSSWPFLWALAGTGARTGELKGLRWGDVDRDAGVVRIGAQVDQGGLYVAPKTAAGMRSIPIGARLAVALDEAERRRRDGKVASTYVFARRDGRPWADDTASGTWRRAQERVWGRHRMRLHDLRHLLASVMLSEGVPLPDVSHQLGHATPAITARIYSWALSDSHRRVAAALERSGIG